uniref:Putative ovule protein n=1 Tax=Solanum chacoense TaxID=4108 RepID=A0A0V0GRP5_SOLCH
MLFHDAKLPLTKTQYPNVERLSEGDLSHSTSLYPMIWWSGLLGFGWRRAGDALVVLFFAQH